MTSPGASATLGASVSEPPRRVVWADKRWPPQIRQWVTVPPLVTALSLEILFFL